VNNLKIKYDIRVRCVDELLTGFATLQSLFKCLMPIPRKTLMARVVNIPQEPFCRILVVIILDRAGLQSQGHVVFGGKYRYDEGSL